MASDKSLQKLSPHILPNSRDFELSCPECQSTRIHFEWRLGDEEQVFVYSLCKNCKAYDLLEMDQEAVLAFYNCETAEEISAATREILATVQSSWIQWVDYKEADIASQKKVQSSWRQGLTAILLIFAICFFVLDELHLQGAWQEPIPQRQEWLEQYRLTLLEVPCLDQTVKTILQTVPIYYTAQGVYHHGLLQYGETGNYFGAKEILVHRSNFWFYGSPKITKLIDTLLHEVRHQINPELGHSAKFHQHVEQDLNCTLRAWPGLNK